MGLADLRTRVMLYGRTLVRLRPRQWAYQALRRLQRRPPLAASRPLPELRDEDLDGLARRMRRWAWRRDTDALPTADEILEDRFRFLEHVETIPSVDWTHRYVSHLWSYQLHYFDYAVDLAYAWVETGEARYLARLEELVQSWVRGTRGARGDGWEPYALSVRVINWTYATLIVGQDLDPATRDLLVESLGEQCAYLERRLEWHVDGNHLQKNFHALATAGLVLRGQAADRWWRKGSQGLWRCVREQVAEDGGHLERSPLYHVQAAADLLQLVELMGLRGLRPPPDVVERARRMVSATAVLSRPNGSLHLFADSVHGYGPPVSKLTAAARAVLQVEPAWGGGPFALPETGYYGVAWPDEGTRMVVDCGEFGARFQPGHGHCDLLSFELDLEGRPVIVDTGVSGYADDPLRPMSGAPPRTIRFP